jgi:hypothetical protein
MAKLERDTTIILTDLEHVAQQVLSEKSPAEARRRFAQFVGLTQKFTAAMRTEFRALTGQTWHAGEFGGWNATTSLFKALRNTDEHEKLVALETSHIRRIPMTALVGNSPANLYLELQYEQELLSQLATDAPNTMTIERPAASGELTTLPWTHREHTFLLVGRTTKITKAIERAGTRDINELTATALETLRQYHEFYVARLAAHGVAAA